MSDVNEIRFSYLDHKGNFHNSWPPEDAKATQEKQDKQAQQNAGLPRAVRVVLVLTQGGNISQLYVIPTENPSPQSTTPDNKPAAEKRP